MSPSLEGEQTPAQLRLQGALEREFPGIECDECIVAHLANDLEGEGLPAPEDLAESWAPFLISLGACNDDNEALAVVRRLLQRIQREASAAAAAPAPAPAATAPPPAAAPSAASAAMPAAPSAPAVSSAAMPQPEEESISTELASWLEKLRLTQYSSSARSWCTSMGAVNFSEVLENWEDFVTELKLKPLERKRVEKDVNSRKPAPAATGGAAVVATPSAPATPSPSPVSPPTPTVPAQTPSSAVHPQKGSFGPAEDPHRYQLLEELGQGVTATVYRCKRGEDFFAVKTISLAKLRLQRNFQRTTDLLNREVQILFKLRHPRIVSLLDVVEEYDKLHLIMELVVGGPEGVELFDYIVARGSFTEPVARYVFLQIVDGLAFIHQKDIVYRDLKPENILVDEKASNRKEGLFEVKLSDFGHSKLINDGYSTALTRVGTPQYWAPEVNDPVKAAKGYDQTVDLWSLGVVLYVMLIGAYPFDGVGEPIEEQIRRARINFRPINGRELSGKAQNIIRELIRVEPKTRLTLDGCRNHAWAKDHGREVMTSFDESHVREERIRLPVQPSKQQVDELRRDLNIWMRNFKCSAQVKEMDVIASLDAKALDGRLDQARHELHQIVQHHFGQVAPPRPAPRRGEPFLAPVPEGRSERTEKRSFRLLSYTLRVSEDHGAGLDLQPERGGMRVERIYSQPGQPGLQSKDLITKINEISLRGNPFTVEEIFGTHFADGAALAIRREEQ